jgi:hypothetical protein
VLSGQRPWKARARLTEETLVAAAKARGFVSRHVGVRLEDMSTQRLHFDLQLATRLNHERALPQREDPKLRRKKLERAAWHFALTSEVVSPSETGAEPVMAAGRW